MPHRLKSPRLRNKRNQGSTCTHRSTAPAESSPLPSQQNLFVALKMIPLVWQVPLPLCPPPPPHPPTFPLPPLNSQALSAQQGLYFATRALCLSQPARMLAMYLGKDQDEIFTVRKWKRISGMLFLIALQAVFYKKCCVCLQERLCAYDCT